MSELKNLDIEKFEEYLRDLLDAQTREMIERKKQAEAYYNGFKDAIQMARNTLHCPTYEKNE